jgi:hypothetical protein
MMDCPICKETMVPSVIEHEKDEWAYGWLCGCNEEIRNKHDDSPVLLQRGVIKPKQFHVERVERIDARGIGWLVVHKQGWKMCEAYARKDAYDISRALNRVAL